VLSMNQCGGNTKGEAKGGVGDAGGGGGASPKLTSEVYKTALLRGITSI